MEEIVDSLNFTKNKLIENNNEKFNEQSEIIKKLSIEINNIKNIILEQSNQIAELKKIIQSFS